MSVIDRDYGYRKLFERALKNDPHRVVVGIHGEAAEAKHGEDGIDNVRLAGVHEFGAQIDTGRGIVDIPERSFIRSTVDDHGGYKDVISKLADKVLTGSMTVPQALGLLGEKVTSDMKRTIEKGIDPPNAPSTIEAKGSDKPLIDTAQMKNSITYAVRKEGEDK